MDIGVWGDSIVYGAGDEQGLGWVGRLRNSFSADGRVGVYNRGVCGDTSADLVKRFTTEVASIEPDKIIFAIGINDSRYRAGKDTNNVLLEDFENNVHSLIHHAKEHTSDVVIIGITQVEDGKVQGSGTRYVNEDIKKYNAVLQQLADTEGLKFIDVFNILNPSEDLDDGLHPNAQGYEKLFKAIRENVTI